MFYTGDTFTFAGLLPAGFLPAGEWTARAGIAPKFGGETYPIAAALVPPAGSDTQWLLRLTAPASQTKDWKPGKFVGEVEFTNSDVSPPFVGTLLTFSLEVTADRVK